MKKAAKKSTVAAVATPTKPGTPHAGGRYMARFFAGIAPRALIVAPKAEGEIEAATYAEALKAAKACRIGGHKDWQVPDRQQSLALYENRKALAKTPDAFAEATYWTSQQHESDSASAWAQGFVWGYQNGSLKSSKFRVRLVRSISI